MSCNKVAIYFILVEPQHFKVINLYKEEKLNKMISIL
jgi:hypothetical protein